MEKKSRTNLIKSILYFGLLSSCIECISKLISNHFNVFQLFRIDFIVFEIIVEFVILIITAFLTHLIILNFANKNLGISILSATLFGVLYAFFATVNIWILSTILDLGKNVLLNDYSSFFVYIPNGLIQGLIFMFVYNHFNSIKFK